MSEENLNQVPNEGVIVPGERADVENRAREQGWVSKEEFEANPRNEGKKWRPAEEFVERGELFDTLKSLKHELVAIKRDFNALADHHKQVAKVEYDRALKTLKEQRAMAAEEGDTATVVKISDAIDELKETHKQEVDANRPQGGVHPAFPAWLEQNEWYQSDPELRAAADAAAQSYMMKYPNSPFEDVLQYASKRVKERFMKSKEDTTKQKTQTVESSGGIPVKQKAGKLTKNDLNDTEKEIMRTLVRSGALTEEEYLNDLAKVKGL